MVSLEYCEVICTFVVDSQVTGVYHSGQQLVIDGPKGDVSMAKTVNFTSCDRMNPGSLTIHGTHDGSGDNSNCIEGGLLLHCSANDLQSPWNNFVSDSDNWVDAEDDSTAACQDEGTTGFLGSTSSDIDDLVGKGAKKIWIDKVYVSLKGTPPTNPTTVGPTDPTTTVPTNVCDDYYSGWIGDGYCDDITNIPECNHDGGDCCGNDVKTNYCNDCICHQ